jgi:hypothetical protein
MAKKYTNMFEITKDVEMYTILRNGGALNLSHIQPIAQNRWTWFVDNWKTLYSRFVTNANGDDEVMLALSSMNREVQNYKLGNTTNPLESISKAIQFDPFISQISLQELKLTPEESILRDTESQRVLNLDIESFTQMIDYIKKTVSIFSQTIGLGDATTAELYGISLESKKKRTATITDLEQIQDLEKVRKYITGIVYDLKTRQKVTPNLLKIANQNIDPTSNVVINENYLSYIPVPFEISLQHMAKKYLNDANRWFELATVNNLQPPFVDESGTKLNLLAPAAVNNLIIPSDLKDRLFVGIKVSVGSYKIREETRIIEKIILNENNTMVLFLSGNQDLNKFKSSEGAFVRVYNPNTVRTNSFVLIPSPTAGFTTRPAPTPSNDDLRRLERAFINFGIDIARDMTTNDFIIDSSGNFKKAAGYPAVKQAVLYALKTTKGELPFHPEFGVTANIGNMFFGTNDEALIFGELLRETLLSDPRFNNVVISRVSTTPTGISLSLLVTIQGMNQPIPLSFIS